MNNVGPNQGIPETLSPMDVQQEEVLINALSEELLLGIFSFLPTKEAFLNASLTCKEFNRLAHVTYSEQITNSGMINSAIRSMTFGAEDWKKCFGVDVGEVPPLPEDIRNTLKGPCPFDPTKKVFQTHRLTLVPEKVNGKPLTLDSFRELIQNLAEGAYKTDYRVYDTNVATQYGAVPSEKSHWVLMPNDVITESGGKSYDDQKVLVEAQGYKMPGVLEATVSIVAEHAKTGVRRFSDDPLTYTRCDEKVNGQFGQDPIVVGGFASGGLNIFSIFGDGTAIGVACLREF